MEELIRQIERFTPDNEQEERDREVLLSMLKGDADLFTRDNLTAHMTASAWVVNGARDRVLMAYHNI